MLDTILFLFSDYTFRTVALGTGLLGLISGVIGSFAVLRKESLLGDALSHAALPGIVIGFLLIGRKEWLVLLLGAAVSGLLATFLISWMNRGAVKFDSALSLILSSFFGFGLVLLTYAQKQPNANQAGLENFIYGQAASMLRQDVIVIAIAAVIMLAVVVLFWKEIKVFTFDSIFAQTVGFSTSFISFILSLMLVVTIILGLESVGVILMSALIIAPAVAARQWTHSLSTMVVLSGVFGLLAGVAGTTLSSLQSRMPTGPSIVIVASLFVFISIIFAPERGLIVRAIQYRRRKRDVARQLDQAMASERKDERV